MAQSVQKIIDKKDRTIVDSENQLLDGFDGIERDIYNSVLKKVRTFDQKDGKIIFDDDTVTGINEINGIVAKSIQDSKYVGKVRDYLRDFETIKQFNFDIHQDINDLSPGELSDLINPVQRQIVNQTLQNLTGQGVNTNFIDPLREGIFKNIVAGTTITDLEGYLNAFINTNPERMGQFKRYVSQVSRDALNQFDGQVNSRIAEEFGLDAFRYVGSIIEDSRPQCVRWVGLGVITAENLSNELSWAYSNGTGMIPGTTVDNFAVYRGGYNCRHSAIPFKLTKSQKRELVGGGEIPPDETPIPEQNKIIANNVNEAIKISNDLGINVIDSKNQIFDYLLETGIDSNEIKQNFNSGIFAEMEDSQKLNILNSINQFHSNNPNLPKTKIVLYENKNAVNVAQYEPITESIEFNSTKNLKKFIKDFPNESIDSFNASYSVAKYENKIEGIYAHELGHLYDFKKGKISRNINSYNYSTKFFDENFQEIQKNVSFYGVEDYKATEFAAELYATKWNPNFEKFPNEIKSYVNEMINKWETINTDILKNWKKYPI